MKNTITNSFKAALWSIALVFGMMACTQMEQDTIKEMSFPSKIAFIKADGINGANFKIADNDYCGSQEYCMLAGQKVLAGAGYTVSNDEDNVYFTIFTSGDWYITEAQLTYGSDYKTMPGVGKNNVAPGQFIWKAQINPALQSHTFTVPIDSFNASTFHFAFHGVVVRIDGDGNVLQGETAYTCGDRIHAKGVWARYNSYTIVECEDTEIEEDCKEDTAFAGAEGAIIDAQGGGWYYLMTLTDGSATGTLFAGKTKEAGTVSITTDGDDIKVNVTLKDGFSLQSGGDNWYVHGYTSAPTVRPKGGQKGDAVTWKKGEATSAPINITLPRNGATIFAVHVNVQECK